ncbi:RNA methyltransferase [Candidatus Micrarchaeota archaeon]|nr:RNA methyltransferase [Candidatus Micrarchaeota archaeon]
MSSASCIRVVLVRPVYSSNLGLVCRVMKNFGFSDLVVVQPASKPVKTKTAYMYAKHSKEVLQNARVVKSLDAAVSDCQLVVGTTGMPARFHRQFKRCISFSELPGRLSGSVALVFGSEGSGLNEAETNACDWMAYVPANAAHPVLNLSHAVAVVLHALSGLTWSPEPDLAPASSRRLLEEKFAGLIADSPYVKDKKKVTLAFRRILAKAQASTDEVRTLMAGLAALERKNRSKRTA